MEDEEMEDEEFAHLLNQEDFSWPVLLTFLNLKFENEYGEWNGNGQWLEPEVLWVMLLGAFLGHLQYLSSIQKSNMDGFTLIHYG